MARLLQNETEITIIVPLRVGYKNPDILVHKRFIKLNSGDGDYYEAFLANDIDPNQSCCNLRKKCAEFRLKKLNSGHWNEILENVEKKTKVQLKMEILNEVQEDIKQNDQKKVEKREFFKQFAVDSELKRISDKTNIVNESNKAACDETLKKVVVKKKETLPTVSKKQNLNRKIIKAHNNSELIKPVRNVPNVRSNASIQIKFSHYDLKTPRRQAVLEENLRAKQINEHKLERDAKVSKEVKSLKDKGVAFFNERSFMDAITAFTEAIKIDEQNYDLYVNRSVAYFRTEKYADCVRDCSTALDLIEQDFALPDNKLKIACKTRRAAALCKLGQLKAGYKEFLQTLELDPKNQQLQHDLELVKEKLNEF